MTVTPLCGSPSTSTISALFPTAIMINVGQMAVPWTAKPAIRALLSGASSVEWWIWSAPASSPCAKAMVLEVCRMTRRRRRSGAWASRTIGACAVAPRPAAGALPMILMKSAPPLWQFACDPTGDLREVGDKSWKHGVAAGAKRRACC